MAAAWVLLCCSLGEWAVEVAAEDVERACIQGLLLAHLERRQRLWGLGLLQGGSYQVRCLQR